ncbi:MAG: hypothetical protein LQ338_000899 [Usnochroma carphineum]|nr:MAG: hypothetical protein LQ338_000899 [Usnochroma carphineum]
MLLGGRVFARLVPFLLLLCARAAVPSPKASTELICHTNHASECYPRIFQPTERFQTVHHDQHLPPGLHVRMNLATGVKEARLNVPEPNEADISSGLTIIEDSDLVDFEPESEQASIIHKDPAVQQPIRPPPDTIAESSSFTETVNHIKGHDSEDTDELLPALTDLEDLSHSYHWGLSLAKDGELIHKLFQLLLPSNLSLEVRSLATLVFGTAIRNNPSALNAALSHFYNDEWPEGPLEAVIMALLHVEAPKLLNRTMFLLSSLCQDEDQLRRFLDADGVKILIEIYGAGSAGSEDNYKLKKKVTHFLVDHLTGSAQEDADKLEESNTDSEWTLVHLHRLEEQRQNNGIPP